MSNLKITVHQWAPELKAGNETFYRGLREIWNKMTPWYMLEEPFSEAGAVRFRNNMKYGGDGWPPSKRLDSIARNIPFSNRFGIDSMYMRTFKPPGESIGVYLHFHGGGWTLGAADGEDEVLNRIAVKTGYTVMSVEYRLAPRYQYPAPIDDCVDAALFILTPESIAEHGQLRVMGGESAGGHLAMVTVMALRKKGVDVRAQFHALVFNYGCFDLGGTPSARNFTDTLILGQKDLKNFKQAWLSGVSDIQIPEISPLFQPDFTNLPPAIFVVGSDDALYDDSLFAAIKWHMGGNKSELTIFPGSKHGVCRLGGSDAEAALSASEAFIKSHISVK